MKKFVLGSIIIVPILAWVLLNSLRFTPLQAVSAHKFYGGGNVEIVKSQPTHYGQAVLLENLANNTFGVRGVKGSWEFFGGLEVVPLNK